MIPVDNIKGFINSGNSCYMDSILFALFLTPNSFIEKYFLRSRKLYINCDSKNIENEFLSELKMVFRQMNLYFMGKESFINDNSCKCLKMIIKKYRIKCSSILSTYPNFSDQNQHESLEFLQYLFTLFGLNGMKNVGSTLVFKKRYGVQSSKSSIEWFPWFERIDKKSSSIFYVNYSNFIKPHKSILRFLNYNEIVYGLESTKYKSCFVNCSEEHIQFQSYSDLFIVAIDRIDPISGSSADP